MADYAGVLRELRAKKEALGAELRQLETVIGGLEKLTGATPRPPASTAAPVTITDTQGSYPKGAFDGLSMPQALMKILADRGEPMSKLQLKTIIVGSGMHAGTNIGSHIYNTLHRLSQGDGVIRREPNGMWSLREWALKANK